MRLERLLQIHIAALAALGALLLGMGQRNATIPLLMLLAAFLSLWLTDITAWFRLNRTVGNVVVLAVLAVSVRQSLRLEGESQILAIGNLLTVMQAVLLFQKKDARSYGQLTMLSLLEVVVAALFNQGLWFGVLLLGEFGVGFSSLVLLSLLRQAQPYRSDLPLPQRMAATGRWRLAGLQAGFVSAPAGTVWAGIGRELFGRLTLMACGTLLLTLLLFFTVPRFGQATWQSSMLAERHVVGFNETVALGELGEIVESPEEVMRLWLSDEATGKPCPLQEAVYLRGAVLTRYQRGRWGFAAPGENAGREDDRVTTAFPLGRSRQPASSLPVMLQKITVEPLDRPQLFCIWPFVSLRRNDLVHFDFRRQWLVRSKERRSKRFSFELGTTGIVNGSQVPLVPCSVNEPLDLEQLVAVPELPNLTALAQQWNQEAGLPPDDRVGRAHHLEQRLRDSGTFQYSLEGQSRNRALDPIEDFLTEHPQGHCEYFATALALMLRSQAIPSRVVVGYRCDDWNELGGFYDVRQLHAHTWVEAYLEASQIPAELRYGGDPELWSAGGWLRLDATPGTAEGETVVSMSTWDWLRHGFRWLESLWVDYVVEMDRNRQHEEIYQPVVRAAEAMFGWLANPIFWRELGREIAGVIGFSRWGQTSGWWIAFALGVLLLALPLWLFYRGARWLVRFVWGRLAGRVDLPTFPGRTEVEFYRRLESLLARRGLVRARSQTQREFAVAAGARLAGTTGRSRLEPLPREVADAFYRVRFGRLPLDNPQALAVEQALVELSELLTRQE